MRSAERPAARRAWQWTWWSIRPDRRPSGGRGVPRTGIGKETRRVKPMFWRTARRCDFTPAPRLKHHAAFEFILCTAGPLGRYRRDLELQAAAKPSTIDRGRNAHDRGKFGVFIFAAQEDI